MASIRPPAGGPPRPGSPLGPRRLEPSTPQPRPAGNPATQAPSSGSPAAGTSRTADVFRPEVATPVERVRQADPALRAPGTTTTDRAARRSETLARASGGATEAYDPNAEKLEEPIEAQTAMRDQGGNLLTPHIDAWIRVIEAGGIEPPSVRGVASELGGLAEADAMNYAGVLHRTAGEPMGAFLRGLGKIEIKSFLRLLGPDSRDGLIGGWASAFKKRLVRREAAAAIAAEIQAVTYASPRSFGRLLEKADPEALRQVLSGLAPAARQELLALVPKKILREAAGPLKGLIPAALLESQKGTEKREPAAAEAPEAPLRVQMRNLVEASKAGKPVLINSPGAKALQAAVGKDLLQGGVPSWRQFGEALQEAATGGYRGANAATLLLRLSMEGLRSTASQAPREASATVLQIPFSLAGRFSGAAGAIFTALGKHCEDEFHAYVEGRGLWRQLVGQTLDALRAEAGDSDAAKAWRDEAG